MDIPATEVVEHASGLSFDATIERLVQAIAHAGMTLFASIDHAALARGVDASMPPATVLIYGNPRAGTPIMLATPQAALDLPLRVLVQQRADGRVIVAFHPVAAMLQRMGVPAQAAARLMPAQRLLLDAVAP